MPPKSDKIWSDALRRAVLRESKGKGSPRWIEVIADRVVADAGDGSPPAVKELGDRLEGKPLQGIDNTSSDGSMTPTKVIRQIVDNKRDGD